MRGRGRNTITGCMLLKSGRRYTQIKQREEDKEEMDNGQTRSNGQGGTFLELSPDGTASHRFTAKNFVPSSQDNISVCLLDVPYLHPKSCIPMFRRAFMFRPALKPMGGARTQSSSAQESSGTAWLKENAGLISIAVTVTVTVAGAAFSGSLYLHGELVSLTASNAANASSIKVSNEANASSIKVSNEANASSIKASNEANASSIKASIDSNAKLLDRTILNVDASMKASNEANAKLLDRTFLNVEKAGRWFP